MLTSLLKREKSLEALWWVLNLLVLIYALSSLLISGLTTLAHDNFYWCLPVFHYFARNLIHGSLPLWNPYTHAGEPFYPLLVQLRLLEPITILTVLVGKFFTRDTVLLFNWNRFLLSLWMVLGVYKSFRLFTHSLFVRLSLVPLLLYSSFFLGSFHQDGILSQFLWVPWIAYLLLQIIEYKKTELANFIFLGIAIGLNFQSYQFVGTWTYLFFFILAVWLFKRSPLQLLLNTPQIILKIGICAGIIFSMLAPNLVLMWESKYFVYPLRMLPENYSDLLLHQTGILPQEALPHFVDVGIRIPYSLIPYTGAFIKIWEFIQLLVPNGNPNIHAYANAPTWGSPSEAYMYLGILPWCVALLGICFGVDPWKKNFALITAVFGLLMMGPPGGLHRLLYPIFPPLWFIRHTDLFVLFFLFGVLYFFILGMNVLIQRNQLPPFVFSKIKLLGTLLFSLGLYCTLMGMSRLEYPSFKFPETQFLFLGIIVVSLVSFTSKSILGREGLFLGLLIAHIAAVLSLSQRPLQSLVYLSLFLLPLFCASWLSWRPPALKFLILILICSDLGFAFKEAKYLYEGQPSPKESLGISTTATPPLFISQRQLAPHYPSSFFGKQVPRYLSLLEGKAYAFSPTIYLKGEVPGFHPDTLQGSLESPRWNSFLLMKNYFSLVNSSMSHEALAGSLAINSDIFQLRVGTLKKDQDNQIWENPAIAVFTPQINSYSFNALSLTTDSPQAGILYWADGFDRYWKARRDGQPIEVHQTNLNFKGFELLFGKHVYQFSYEPLPFEIALLLFYGIPLLALTLATLPLSIYVGLLHRFRLPVGRHITQDRPSPIVGKK